MNGITIKNRIVEKNIMFSEYNTTTLQSNCSNSIIVANIRCDITIYFDHGDTTNHD